MRFTSAQFRVLGTSIGLSVLLLGRPGRSFAEPPPGAEAAPSSDEARGIDGDASPEATAAQPSEPEPEPQASSSEVRSERIGDHPRIHLMCPQDCFDSYLRQELSYFDIVRQPQLAEYVVLVVRQRAANGGERFTVTITATDRARSPIAPIARAFVSEPGASIHTVRESLRTIVIRALYPIFVGTEHEAAFDIGLPKRDGNEISDLDDPWNYWVFVPAISGESDGVGSYYAANATATLTVRRITSRSKLRFVGNYERALSSYELEDGSRVRGDVYRWGVRTIYAHSITEHLSLGGVVASIGAEFENLRGHVHGAAIAEANVFPFAQNARRQLRFAYQVGSWSNWYFERTVNDRTRETHPYHALSMIVDVNQRWGSVQWIGQVNQFLDAPELFRAATGATLSLRVAQGFAVTLSGELSWVKDQISLRQRPVTDTELLLWTAQQPTDHQYWIELGISYTFGSVLNTIVNPRFGRIDLEDE